MVNRKKVTCLDFSIQIFKNFQVSVNNKIDKRLTTPASDTMSKKDDFIYFAFEQMFTTKTRFIVDTLIQQGSQGQYDFCYIDADKTNYDTYYEQCLTLLRPLGMILFDNVKRIVER